MFSRARQLLDAVESRNRVTVQDVMNIFDDLYEDIVTDEGVSFEELPGGDGDEVAASTIRMVNRIRRLYKKNPEIFSTERYRERWESASAKLDEVEGQLGELQNQEEEWRRKRKETEEIREKCDDLKQKIEKLQAAHAQAEADWKRMVREEQELSLAAANALQERKSYESDRIPKARTELADARKYLESAKTLKDELDLQLAEIEDHYRREKTEIEEKQSKVDAAGRTLGQRLQEERERLENLIRENQEKQGEMGALVSNLQSELEQKEQERKELEEQKNNYQIRCETAINEISKAGEQTEQWKMKCLQAEKLRDQEYQNIYRLMDLHKKTLEEINAKKKLWNSVWSAHKEEQAALEEDGRPESDLEERMNEAVARINRDISDFERGYANLLRNMERRLED